MSRFAMILNYDKDNGFSLSIKKIIPDISDEVKNLFKNLDSDSQFNILLEDFFDKDSFDDTIFKTWVAGLNDTEKASMTAGDALEQYKTHLTDISKQTDIFTKLGSTLKTIGGTLVSTFANIAVSMAASWVVTTVFSAISNQIDEIIHKSERLIETGEEARTKIQDINDSYNEKVSFNSENGERFEELRKGVNQKTNDNISLTNDDYSEYLSLCNEIAEIYPSLVTSFDSQGNAILNLGSSAETATEQLNTLLESQKNIADYQKRELINDDVTGTLEEIKTLQDELDAEETRNQRSENVAKTTADRYVAQFKEAMLKASDETLNSFTLKFDTDADIGNINELVNILRDYGYVGTSRDNRESGGDYFLDFMGMPDENEIDAILKEWASNISGAVSDAEYEIVENDVIIQNLQNQISEQYNQVLQSALTSLEASENFQALPEAIQGLLRDSLNNIHWEDVTSEDGFKMNDFIDENIIKPMVNSIENTDIENALEQLSVLKERTSSLNLSDYSSSVNEQLDIIKKAFKDLGMSDEEYTDFIVKLGFKIVDEDGHAIDSITSLKSEIEDVAALKGEDARDLNLDELTVDQLIELHATVTDSSYGDTVAKAIAKIVFEAQSVADSVTSTPITFASLLSDDAEGSQSTLSKQLDDFQSNISSIKSALDNLNTGEDINLVDLFQEFPELISQTDNLEEALNNLKNQNFADIIGSIFADIDPTMISDAKNFITALFDDANISEDDFKQIRSKLTNSLLSADGLNTIDRQEIMGYIDMLFSGINISETTNSIQSATTALADMTTYQDSLNTAMEASISATGLTTEQVEALTDAYKDLDGFNANKLFEKTANGIHLNEEALKELNEQLEESTAADIYQQIAEKQRELNEAKLSGGDISWIQNELSTLQNLAAQYDAATSAYQKFLKAKSGGNERDSYEGIGASYDEMEQTLNEGWYDDKVLNAYLDLMLSASQRTGDTYEDFQKLKQTIDGTNHSLMDYWVYDENDNLVTDGLFDFLDDVNAKFGDAYASIDENGQYAFDFTGDKLQEVADAFGMSTDMVELFAMALGDIGIVNLGDTSSFIMQINEAKAKIQELQEEGELSEIDLDFNTDDMSLDEIQDKIKELQTESAEIDIETNPESKQALDDLISSLQQEYYLQLNTATDGDLDTAVSAVNQIHSLIEQTQNEAPISISAIVNGSEQIQTLAEEIASLPPEVQTAVGIKTENVGNVEGILGQLASNPESITVPVNYTKGEEPETVSNATGVANFDLGDSPTTVPDATGTANFKLGSYPTSLPTITQTVVRNITEQKSGAASGTAHVQGTTGIDMWNNYRYSIGAYAQGNDWMLPYNENALVNELGNESIVRDGKWFLIPGGAHTETLKKGDIVFSAEQTKELIRTGRVISGGGHGRVAHATGTAYNMLSAFSSGTNLSRRKTSSSSSSTASSTANTAAVNANTSATKNNTSTIKTSLEKLQEKLAKLFDWIEVKLNSLQQTIDYRTAKSENAVGYSAKNSYLTKAQTTTQALINANKTGQTKYAAQAKSVYNQYMALSNSAFSKESKKQLKSAYNILKSGGTLNIKSYNEEVQEAISNIKEWYDKSQDCKLATVELQQELRDLAQTKLDNITEQYDAMLSHIEYQANLINGFIDQAEIKGYVQSTKYYDVLIKNASAQKADLVAERNALTASLKDSMDSGIIKQGSVEWYNMQTQINDVTESIQEADTNILKFGNSIRQIQWDVFDMAQDKVERITDETGFLIDLMSDADMFTDKGLMTDHGLATLGLHGVNYNTYMAQADKYKEEMLQINKELANDPNNTTLIDRREELLDLQYESILAAEDEKQAISDLIKDGIEKELDSLQDLVDKYKDALDNQKDLLDYQKNVSDQTSEIAKLRKRLAAYSGDDSEEGRLKAQQAQNALKEAEQALQESEYDKFISDQEKLLDDLYSEYEEALNSRLDNIDQLITDTIVTINENATKISEVLNTEASEVGVTLTSEMQSIWGGDGTFTTVLSTYSKNFTSTMTTVNGAIGSILENVKKLVENADKQATNDVVSAGGNSPSSASNNATGGTSSSTTSSTVSNALTNVLSTVSSSASKISGSNALDLIKLKISTYKKGTYKSDNHSDLYKYIHKKSGRLIDTEGMLYIGQQLGVSGLPSKASKLTSSNKTAILKKLKAAGYASGTKRVKQDELAQINENGQEIVTLPDGSILMPVKRGTGVINNPNTEKLLDLAEDYEAIQKMIDIVGSVPYTEQMGHADEFLKNLNTNVINNKDKENVNVTNDIIINVSGITNYEEFATKMRNDPKMQTLWQNSTIGLVNGNSRLAKYQNRW